MNKARKKVMIIAGGTGGHVFPGLSIALCLINFGYQVCWLGTVNNIEAKLIPQYNIEIKFIYITGLLNKNLYTKLKMPFLLCKAIFQSRRIIKFWKPDIVLGMGGYVSGPGGLAAWICRVPLIIHEQNRVFGLTNRCLSIFAKRVLRGLSDNFISKGEIVGNPIREEILSIPDPKKRWGGRTGPLRVLVIGGSQGSCVLNYIIPEVFKVLSNKIIVKHQVGKRNFKKIISVYSNLVSKNYQIFSFIQDIAQAYAWADILISRSGALTVSEVSIVGLGAIFIPFLHKDRQQYWNALSLVNIGAAKIVEQNKFTKDYIIQILDSLNRSILLKMAEKSKTLAIPSATQRIVQIINKIV